MENSARRLSVEDMQYHDTRAASLVIIADVLSNMVRSHTSTPRTHTSQSRPFYALKRRASQSGIVASNNSLKVFTPKLTHVSSLINVATEAAPNGPHRDEKPLMIFPNR